MKFIKVTNGLTGQNLAIRANLVLAVKPYVPLEGPKGDDESLSPHKRQANSQRNSIIKRYKDCRAILTIDVKTYREEIKGFREASSLPTSLVHTVETYDEIMKLIEELDND